VMAVEAEADIALRVLKVGVFVKCRRWLRAFIDVRSQFGKSYLLLLPAVGQD
jgi:hypothetical protein